MRSADRHGDVADRNALTIDSLRRQGGDCDDNPNIGGVNLPGREGANFDIVFGFAIRGSVAGQKDVALDTILIRLNPAGWFTIPYKSDNFAFYSVSSVTYEVELAPQSLPEHAVLTTPHKVPVEVRAAQDNPNV